MMRSRLTAAIAAVLMTGTATAAEFEYGLSAGVGTSDNITRVPSGGDSETILSAGLDLSLEREGSLLNADVRLDLDYLDYQDSTWDSEVTGMAEADLRFAFLPNRFEWVVQDSFGQMEINPFATPTPDNRENVNYFTTGPNVLFRLGAAGSVTLFGRYSLVDYEDTGRDNDRRMGGLTFARELSARSSLALNASAERIEYDDPAFGSSYDRQTASLRYEISGARTRIAAEAGHTELHDRLETSSSPLLTLEVERDLTRRSMLTLRAGIRSMDDASSLRAGHALGGGVPPRPGQISTADPYETHYASLGWTFTAPRTGFAVSTTWEEDEQELLSALDRERFMIAARAHRQLTPRLRAQAVADFRRNDYGTVGFDDDETHLGLQLAWSAGRQLSVEFELEHFMHDSSNPLNEFDETRAFVRLAWRGRGSGGPG